MDTSDPYIKFNKNGICNHCEEVEEKRKKYPHYLKPKEKKIELNKLISDMKKKGKRKKYDCIIGLSGGVDSTFLAYHIKKMGLKPLAVHLDNSWNSELAVHNIEKICKKTGIDLYTYIIDWEEFRDIQLSFLKASTPDSEIPTDHAIMAILYKVAVKNRVKYILSGANFNTESILPFAWSHGHRDWKYIKNIQKKFGKIPFKTFPKCSYIKLFYYMFIKKIKVIDMLDFLDYKKENAIKILTEKLDWQQYKGKHQESIYTKFFQSYILPEKFGFDKRRAHLSSLICSGEITKEEALKEIKKELYPSYELEEDRDYVIKKLGIASNEFREIMNLPPKEFCDYPSYENSWYYKIARKTYRIFNKRKRI